MGTKIRKKEKPKKKEKKKKKMLEGIRGIVRIAEVDLEGDKKIRNVLLGVKGIGKSLAKGIAVAADLNPEALLGSLDDGQIKKLKDVIKDPGKYGIPSHMFNRRFDPSTGENKHLVSSDLRFTIRSDIGLMKKTRSYKGIRHELGLPVRGQRTRTSFRGGAIVGVAKKKEMRSRLRKKARSEAKKVAPKIKKSKKEKSEKSK